MYKKCIYDESNALNANYILRRNKLLTSDPFNDEWGRRVWLNHFIKYQITCTFCIEWLIF